MGKRLIVFLTLLILLTIPMMVSAQEPRDYEIISVDWELIDDDTVIRVTIVVQNNGGDAVSPTDVMVRLLGDPPVDLVTDSLIPLAGGSGVTLEIPFAVDLFPQNTQQTLEVRVGLDAFERENSPIATDNIATLDIDVPERLTTTELFSRTDDGVIINGEEYTLVQVALGALALVTILMIFWMIVIFLRAVFKRSPRLGAWQPPYGIMPMYDQNTVEGRRWGWQQVAQNGLLLAPPSESNIHAVKLLMGADGTNLANWKVTGMRLSQYDVYGRIARTQVIADKKSIRRMNNLLKKRTSTDEAKLQKMLRPITQSMVKQFTKKLSKNTAFLPIAFDIRWQGKHGDVRIIFELYQFSERAWYRIDQWDPMMQVVSQTMQENYTFTIHGKETAEKMRDFRERLRDDLIWLLLESFRVEVAPKEATGAQPAVREQFDVPDTLSDMDPITQQDDPVSA